MTVPETRPVTRWWWIRHAPVDNPDRRLYGQTDLDARLDDAAAVGRLAARLPEAALWLTSTLSRTRQTAAALIARRDGTDRIAARHETLNEQHFGDWQGLSLTELRAIGPAFEKLWAEPGATRPPGGESFAEVIARVAATIDRVTTEHGGRDIVVVAHGGSIRAALAHALGLDAEAALGFTIDTLSLTRIDHLPPDTDRVIGAGRRWRVEAVNLRP